MFAKFVPQTEDSLNVSFNEYNHISLTQRDQHFAHNKNISNIILLDRLTIRGLQITRKF